MNKKKKEKLSYRRRAAMPSYSLRKILYMSAKYQGIMPSMNAKLQTKWERCRRKAD